MTPTGAWCGDGAIQASKGAFAIDSASGSPADAFREGSSSSLAIAGGDPQPAMSGPVVFGTGRLLATASEPR